MSQCIRWTCVDWWCRCRCCGRLPRKMPCRTCTRLGTQFFPVTRMCRRLRQGPIRLTLHATGWGGFTLLRSILLWSCLPHFSMVAAEAEVTVAERAVAEELAVRAAPVAAGKAEPE